MNNKWIIGLALVGGVFIGLNWVKIKKLAGPITQKISERSQDGWAGALRSFAELKERLEDQRAAHRTGMVLAAKTV